MPWAARSTRRTQLPPDWDRTRRRILARDHHRCTHPLADGTRCPEHATDVDHIRRGNNHTDANLTSLCTTHHSHKSSNEGHEAMRTARAKAKHPAEPHPGRR